MLFKDVSVATVVKTLGPPYFWCIYHSTSAVRRWLLQQEWSDSDNKAYIVRWVILAFKSLRDSVVVLQAYKLVAFVLTLLRLKDLPISAQLNVITMSPHVPARIRGRLGVDAAFVDTHYQVPGVGIPDDLLPVATAAVHALAAVDASVASADEACQEANLDSINDTPLMGRDVDDEPPVPDAPTAVESGAAGGSGRGNGVDRFVELNIFEEGLQSEDPIPDADQRATQRGTSDYGGGRKRVLLGDGGAVVHVNTPTNYFVGEPIVIYVAGANTTTTCIGPPRAIIDPPYVVLRCLLDQSGASHGCKKWHMAFKPFNAGTIVDIPDGATTIPNPAYQGAIDVVKYLNTSKLGYLIQLTCMLRSADANISMGERAGGTMEGTIGRMKAFATQNTNLATLSVWKFLVVMCGIVPWARRGAAPADSEEDTAFSRNLTTASNACIPKPTPQERRSACAALRGFLDGYLLVSLQAARNSARGMLWKSRCTQAHTRAGATAISELHNQLVEDELATFRDTAGIVEDGYHNRVGLSQEVQQEFVVPGIRALKVLKEYFSPNSLGTWVGQVNDGGHLRDLWLSNMVGPKSHIRDIAASHVTAWLNPDKKGGKPRPTPDGDALEWCVLLAFFRFVEAEPWFLVNKPRVDWVERGRDYIADVLHEKREVINKSAAAKESLLKAARLPPPAPLLPRGTVPDNAVLNVERLIGVEQGAPLNSPIGRGVTPETVPFVPLVDEITPAAADVEMALANQATKTSRKRRR